jgi:hypothetical protein
MFDSNLIKQSDIELQSLKEELSKLEIKLQFLSNEKNEYLRDIEDFNLQYNLYLGELIENILRLKKDIVYKKNNNKKDTIDSENYEEIKDTIFQIESALCELENSLKTLDKDDLKYTETFNLYNQLKEELQNLTNQKDEIEEQIYSFKDRDSYVWEYTSAKHNYEEYYQEYTNIQEDIENNITLNDEEKLEIKSLWKKACKLCHPDIVTDDLKEKAHEVMQALNEAYSQKDIEKIKSILKDLEHGFTFVLQSESINDLELLNVKISEYQEQIKIIELDIEKIKNDTTFKLISQENNWNNHFQKIKQNLKEEKKKLENQLFLLIQEEKNKFDLYIFSNNVVRLKNKSGFESYLESCFLEMENFFDSKCEEDIKEISFDLEKIVYDLQSNNFICQQNSSIVNAFLILLAQQFEKIIDVKLMRLIVSFLPECGIKKRIKASLLYLNQEKLPSIYFEDFSKIISLLSDSVDEDESNFKASNIFFRFYLTAYNYFVQTGDQDSLNLFNQLFIDNQSKYNFFIENKSFLDEILTHVNINCKESININQFLLEYQTSSDACKTIDEDIVLQEDSVYAQSLYSLDNPTFDDIKKISSEYIKSIGNPDELFYQLNRGMKVIDDEKLLFKYLQSFGEKHKIKLYSAYDEIFEKIKNRSFNIIDWGCGQAFATMILLDYLKNKNIELDISEIILIEPSKLALSRGLLHIDILKQREYKIKTINCEIDCLKEEDILFKNNSFTLHLFSNILDIEDFKINDLLNKISSGIQNDSLFVCISPKINDKRSNRLNLFYKYFDENFNTELISSRDTDIGNTTRYEKIFEIKYITEEVIEEKRQEMIIVEKSYNINIIDELSQYTEIIVPILNMEILENSINTDPEYAIFKIRKVAEIITTQIYSKYEDNDQIISFNDKIRYLAYEQKVFTKASTNYVQTLRTIGNRGVHGNESDISKLRLDAHLMVIALISFIKEIKDDRLI